MSLHLSFMLLLSYSKYFAIEFVMNLHPAYRLRDRRVLWEFELKTPNAGQSPTAHVHRPIERFKHSINAFARWCMSDKRISINQLESASSVERKKNISEKNSTANSIYSFTLKLICIWIHSVPEARCKWTRSEACSCLRSCRCWVVTNSLFAKIEFRLFASTVGLIPDASLEFHEYSTKKLLIAKK